MKRRAGRSGVCPAPIIWAGAAIIAAAVFIAGCGLFSGDGRITKHLYKGVGNSKGSLIKTLAVLPFDAGEQWSGVDLETHLLKALKSAIEKECDHVRVLLPDSPGFPAGLKQLKPQENGEMDNYTLALSGRVSGVNLILFGRLVNIRYLTEDHGMWWWAGTRHLARIQMEFAVFHTGTGAKLFDETVIENIKIKEAEGRQIKENKLPDTVQLTDTLAEIAETIGEIGDTVFNFIPWEGHVAEVNGDRLILSSGESSGLKKGKVLDVFSADEVTKGKSGRRFFKEGNRIGSITLTAVYPDRSEAVLKEGGPIPPGSVARLP